MGVKRERCGGLQLQQKKESQEELQEEEAPEEGVVNDVLGREGKNSKNGRSQLKAAAATTFIPKSGRIWKSQAQRQKASQQRRQGKRSMRLFLIAKQIIMVLGGVGS